MREWILKIVSWVSIVVMFAYIGAGLAKQFDPDNIGQATIRPIYTEAYVEELILEKIYYKKGFKEIEEILQ